MKSSTDLGFEIAKRISELGFINDTQSNVNQFISSSAPLIANEIYKRENELKEIERLETLIALSKEISDNHLLHKVIKGLKYKVILDI